MKPRGGVQLEEELRAKRPQNVRAIAAFALQNLRKIGKSFTRVRRSFAARLALRKRSFGVQLA